MNNTQKRMALFLLAASLAAIMVIAFVPQMYKYISAEKPVNSEVIIVRGWLYPYMYDEVTKRINCSNTSLVIVTGQNKTTAFGREQLCTRGFCNEKIEEAPYQNKCRFESFWEAKALKVYLEEKHPDIKAVNLFTSSVYGRKSQKIFQRVLGNNIRVGIYTCKSNSFNQDRLWFSRKGMFLTLKLTVGYLYALVWPFKV